MAEIIDGNKIAKSIRSKVRLRVKTLSRPPGLAVIQLGQEPASTVYVNHKIKDCHRVNFHSEVHRLSENVSQNRVLELVDRLNNLQKIDGILLQMPTPDHIDSQAIIDTILPTKDVDGLSSANQGGLLIGRHQVTPCTPTGIIRLLDEIGLDIAGKKAVCIGRSTLVGKPVGLLLMERNATVTYCHSKTENLATETRQADILISAVGRPRMITSQMVKPDAVIIDVGINRVGQNLVGDVDFEAVEKIVSAITPVPGGVGPMTRAILLENTLRLAEPNIG